MECITVGSDEPRISRPVMLLWCLLVLLTAAKFMPLSVHDYQPPSLEHPEQVKLLNDTKDFSKFVRSARSACKALVGASANHALS